MQLKEASVSYTGTINLGEYNSVKLGVTLTVVAEESETVESVTTALLEQSRGIVRDEARRLMQRRGARVDEIFAGLPVEVQQQIKGA